MSEENHYQYEAAAKLLNISVSTLHNWKASGFIQHVKDGPRGVLFAQSEIDRLKPKKIGGES
jgi:excisionase family DNA binding protein